MEKLKDSRLDQLQKELKELAKEFHQSLITQERHFTVQDQILSTLTDIRAELKHAMKNFKIEREAKDVEVNERIVSLERELFSLKAWGKLIKIQWVVIVGIVGIATGLNFRGH